MKYTCLVKNRTLLKYKINVVDRRKFCMCGRGLLGIYDHLTYHSHDDYFMANACELMVDCCSDARDVLHLRRQQCRGHLRRHGRLHVSRRSMRSLLAPLTCLVLPVIARSLSLITDKLIIDLLTLITSGCCR